MLECRLTQKYIFSFQIDTDLAPDKAIKLLNQPTDLDLPGLGAFYCLHW